MFEREKGPETAGKRDRFRDESFAKVDNCLVFL